MPLDSNQPVIAQQTFIPLKDGGVAHRTDPKEYVLGCALCDYGTHVVTILKQKPKWQEGRWNLVGGKIEPTDKSPLAAMIREWEEETGCFLPIQAWSPLAFTQGVGWTMHVFMIRDRRIHLARTNESETVMVRRVADVLADPMVLPSLKFYIPLALEAERGMLHPVNLRYGSPY